MDTLIVRRRRWRLPFALLVAGTLVLAALPALAQETTPPIPLRQRTPLGQPAQPVQPTEPGHAEPVPAQPAQPAMPMSLHIADKVGPEPFRYQLTVTTSREYRLSTTNEGGLDLVMRLYRGDELVAQADDHGLDLNPRLTITLDAGSYTIEVAGFSDHHQGDFMLHIEPQQAHSDAPEAEDGPRVVTAMLTAGARNRESLRVAEAGTYVLTTYSDIDLYMTLLGENGRVIDENDDGGEGLNPMLRLTLEPGQYVVVVRGYRESVAGSYRLHLQRVGEGTAPATPQPPPIEPRVPTQPRETLPAAQDDVPAMIDVDIPSRTNTRIASNGRTRFRLVLDERMHLRLSAFSSIDTTMGLFSGRGVQLGFNDDTNGLNPQLEEWLDAGRYTVEVRPYSDGNRGDIIFAVERLDIPWRRENCLPASVGDAVVANGHADYVVTIPADGAYDVTVYSDTDTALIVMNAERDVLAEDTNGGVNGNPALRLTLEEGTYFVRGLGSYREPDTVRLMVRPARTWHVGQRVTYAGPAAPGCELEPGDTGVVMQLRDDGLALGILWDRDVAGHSQFQNLPGRSWWVVSNDLE